MPSKCSKVQWHAGKKKWQVELSLPKSSSNGKERQRICGGSFAQKAMAEERALGLAKAHGLGLRVQAQKLREVQPRVPYRGVTWNRASQAWQSSFYLAGMREFFQVKPQGFSKLQLEKSFRKAVAWHKKQLEKHGKA